MSDEYILNIAEGVGRVVNNRALYGKLLVRFADTMADAPEKIATLLAEGARDDAHRLAHTVKGSAANLSAKALAEAARLVEAAIAESQPVDHLLEEMRGVLKQTLKEMAAFQV